MARKLDYHWHLRQVLADRGMFATTDLIEPLARRGIALSSSQVYRLVVERPERLSLKILMALLDILDCSMSELIEPAATGGGRFDQLAHRAVQDVQQRHQDLQAQAFGSFDDEAVNLAGGQRDPAPGQRFDQVGGGEHAAVGQHLRQVLADRGMFATTDLLEPLARRGIALSSSQVYRLVVERPERLSLKILMALLDILDCSMSELIEPAATGGGRAGGAKAVGGTESGVGQLRPKRARITKTGK